MTIMHTQSYSGMICILAQKLLHSLATHDDFTRVLEYHVHLPAVIGPKRRGRQDERAQVVVHA